MTTLDATVLVLGGAGSVGSETVRQLARRGTFRRILVADRNFAAAQQLAHAAGAEAVGIDVTDTPALITLMRRAQVVLNATGPFGHYGLPVVQAALAAQVHYADVNDEVEPLQELFGTAAVTQAARAAGVTLVVGLGMSPGMTNIIARYGVQQLDSVTAVHFAVCTGPWTRGPAVWAHRLHVNSSMATIYRDGRWQQVPAMSEAEEVTFPWPPRRSTVHIVAHPEPLMLPRHFPGVQEVVTKLGYPDATNQLIRQLVQSGLASQEVISLGTGQIAPRHFIAAYLASPQADERFGFSSLTPYSLRQVGLHGTYQGRPVTLRYQLATRGGPPETALPLVIAGEMLASGTVTTRGLLAPEALDPLPFLRALPSLGARTRIIREEEGVGMV
jgi:saccharopine dehydrogenase-like NADP-dependent oxidoreductase